MFNALSTQIVTRMEGLKKELFLRVKTDFPHCGFAFYEPELGVIDPVTGEVKKIQPFTILKAFDLDRNFQTFCIIALNPGEEIYMSAAIISSIIEESQQGRAGQGTFIIESNDFSSKELVFNGQIHLYTDKANFDKEIVKSNFKEQVGVRFIIKEFENNLKIENRKALIIGMNEYEYANPLLNPVNDAYAINSKLNQLGFETTLCINLNLKDLKIAIDQFCEESKDADVRLVFYAGHGLQHQGVNYLIPVDANIRKIQQLEYDCVEAERILRMLHDVEAENKTNIVILDACRNNPFHRALSRELTSTGLAAMDAPRGTIIAYSTSPGKVALDGEGANSPYTSELLAHIDYPYLKIEDLFKRVRRGVEKQTDGSQTPWETTSLVGDFYFKK